MALFLALVLISFLSSLKPDPYLLNSLDNMLDTKDRIAPVQERVPKESYCERQLSIRRKRLIKLSEVRKDRNKWK
jgi:hypothetical protein